MRIAFITELSELAAHDPRIWLLCGDLGYSVLEPFRERFADRFINVGVAEQNMIGVAAGLALSGLTPFVYSIANFPTLRCLEQIRNDVCYHGANVKIVSVGAGFSYGPQGFTHHGLHDVAVMRTLPGMTVVAPGDPIEARGLTRALAQHPGPAYLRLAKSGEPAVHRAASIVLGRAIQLRDGRDLTIISSGALLPLALQTADTLAADGLRARVLSMHTIKPLDLDALRAAALETGRILTLEEHSRVGGLGSAVAEALLAHDLPARLRVFAAPDRVMHDVGSQEYLRRLCGDPLALARELLSTPGEPLRDRHGAARDSLGSSDVPHGAARHPIVARDPLTALGDSATISRDVLAAPDDSVATSRNVLAAPDDSVAATRDPLTTRAPTGTARHP